MRFSIDIIFQKGWLESAVVFKIRDIINVSCSLVVLDDDEKTRFLMLIGQKILRGILQQIDVENKMDFYEFEKIEFDNQKIDEYSFD